MPAGRPTRGGSSGSRFACTRARPTSRERSERLGRLAALTKALITGGAGFIGSHLTELLLADGWEVFALDDLSTGSLPNVAQVKERPGYHLVVDSVLSP